ncbi:long-chain fatty acid--CoA ligase [Planococcus sp. ANT_H30]|uniref:Long-chain fatty acid--CoA ligase n=1 Tax=Planococcus kocurii TaxID=1374 RepID=A0ABM5WYS2_9BACL|nr:MULTISPECIES: AMP-binding protein [Planococcus]ALS79491.1 long-chain fatty acid--CoA ligase [Planococcus kocurii]KAA0956995.1 long-chain fatty acid--CoA ligase [Planococcus sp. ANT_H30]
MNITTSLRQNAKRFSDKMAITCEGRSYTYQELNEEVNRLANGLLETGLQKGDKVSLFMKNSDYYVLAFFAVLKAGGVAVPVNYQLSSDESGYIFGQSDSRFIFCDAEFELVVAEEKAQASSLQQIIVHPAPDNNDYLSWESVVSENALEPSVEVFSTDDAEILYTSGTTGKPKGALFDHQRLANVSASFVFGVELKAEDRILHAVPLFHSVQLNLYLVTGILLGTSNVIVRDFEPVKAIQAINEFQVSVFFGLPDMYSALLQMPDADTVDVSSVTKCMYGADPIEADLVKQAMTFFGHQQFYNLCLLTEGGPGGVFLLPAQHEYKVGSGGKPMYFTEVRVVDEEFRDVQPGTIGEFVIKGATVMKEYFKKPQETEEAFQNGWLLTGDLATIDEDGFISLVDRKADRIISAGENIYSIEVEQVINSHPQVAEAATVGLPEEEWGEIVGVVIVPKQGETIDEEKLMDYFLEHLPGYKIPRKYRIADSLPRSGAGKIVKYKLRELHISEFEWFRKIPESRY